MIENESVIVNAFGNREFKSLPKENFQGIETEKEDIMEQFHQFKNDFLDEFNEFKTKFLIDSLINQFSQQNNYLFHQRNTDNQLKRNLESVKSKET